MPPAFPENPNIDCPSSDQPEIPFDEPLPGDLPDIPDPRIDIPLLDFPAPVPPPPLGCFLPQAGAVTVISDDQPEESRLIITPTGDDNCDFELSLELHIPIAPGLDDLCPIVQGGAVTITTLQDVAPSGFITIREVYENICDFVIDLDLNIPSLCTEVAAGPVTITRDQNLPEELNPDYRVASGALSVIQLYEDQCDLSIALDLDIPCSVAIVGGTVSTIDNTDVGPDEDPQTPFVSATRFFVDQIGDRAAFIGDPAGITGRVEIISPVEAEMPSGSTPTKREFVVHLDQSFDRGNGAERWPENIFVGCVLAFNLDSGLPNFGERSPISGSGGNKGLLGWGNVDALDKDSVGLSFFNEFPEIPDEHERFTIFCLESQGVFDDGGTPVTDCEDFYELDIHIPCQRLTVTEVDAHVSFSSSSEPSTSTVSETHPEVCDTNLALSLDIPLPFCGIVQSKIDDDEEIYSIVPCDPLLVNNQQLRDKLLFEGVINKEAETYVLDDTGEVAIDHEDVPSGTRVDIHLDTAAGTFFFAHYMDPKVEECIPPETGPGLRIHRLWGYPAGVVATVASPAPSIQHEIIVPDVDGIGWLPVSHFSVPTWQRPEGARFWYNLPTHPVAETGSLSLEQLYALAIASFGRSIRIEIDGVVPPFAVAAPSVLSGEVQILFGYQDEDPLVIFTETGIWWMKDYWGNVPWVDEFATVGDLGDYYYSPAVIPELTSPVLTSRSLASTGYGYYGYLETSFGLSGKRILLYNV